MDSDTMATIFLSVLFLIIVVSGILAFRMASEFGKNKWVFSVIGLLLSTLIVCIFLFSILYFDQYIVYGLLNFYPAKKGIVYVPFIVFGSVGTLALIKKKISLKLSKNRFPNEIDSIGNGLNN
jgi:hypothetical protein